MSRDLEAQLRALLGESPVSKYRVEDVTRIYRQRVLPRYRKNRGRNISLGGLLDLIDDLFCDQPASSFGPKKLAKLRDELLAEGNSRKYINERIITCPYRCIKIAHATLLYYGQIVQFY